MKKRLKDRRKFLLIMKLGVLPVLIALLAFDMVKAGSATGQKVLEQEVNLQVANTQVRSVLRQIEKQTKARFIYSPQVVPASHRVTLQVSDMPLSEVLDRLLTPLEIVYDVSGGHIVLDKAKENAPTSNTGSDVSVKGRVTDEKGDALPGVSILLKGTQQGTSTNGDGRFVLSSPNENTVLVFSYVGYISQEIQVGNRTVIDVLLKADEKILQEVVVIGYGTAKKTDLTGSISSVDASQIEKIPVNTVGQAMQGRMSGVQVTSNDGAPGGGVSVFIRGVGSFGNNSPLYVVDGYPLSGGIGSINPYDILSIDVLKDASSAAIYGNRAANGVVIITTKRGKKDGMQISFDITSSIQTRPRMYKVLNAQQFATLAAEVAISEKAPVLPEWSNPSSLRNIDWQDEIYRQGLRQNYNLGLRGGSEKLRSSLSLAYTDQTGIVKFSDFRRFNAAVTQDWTPKKWFKSSTDIKYAFSDGTTVLGSGQGGLGKLSKMIPTMSGNSVTNEVKDKNGIYGFYTKDAVAVKDNDNIFAEMETADRKNASHNLIASTYLEVSLFNNLKVKSNFGVTYSGYSGYNFSPSSNRSSIPRLASYSQEANNNFEWLWENTVSYSKTFGAHSVDFVGGISAQKNTFSTLSTSGTGLISDELRNVGSLTTGVASSGYQQDWSLASQFGRLSYKFLDRYIVTGTIRRDGSSRFAKGQKHGVFPSVAAAWKLKNESFLANVEGISDLKLRASYGQAGNQNIGLFQYETSYTTGTNRNSNRAYVFGQTKVYTNGLVMSFLPNPLLKWETSTQKDIGLDLSVFNHKLSFAVDYFDKTSRDFLLNIQVPSQTGFETATRNVGSISNSGLEFAVNYNNDDHAFKYGISANITTVKNKILEFADGLTSVSNFSTLNFPNYGSSVWQVFSNSRIGGAIGNFYGFKTDGIIQSQAEIDQLNANAREKNTASTYYIASTTAPGDRKFADTNGDGRITEDDRVNLGSPMPKFYGGFNFDGSYKNFDFNLFVNYVFGNKIMNYTTRNLTSLGGNGSEGLENVSVDFYNNRWTPNNLTNAYPRAVWKDLSGNGRPSDAFIEDGSFLKLKNVQIGYSFNGGFLKKMAVKKLRLYVSAQNLLTLTRYSGLDPELGEAVNTSGVAGGVTAFGLDVGNYPSSRLFTLGLNVQF